MKCKDCSFCWKAEDDDFARCHFVPFTPWDSAPCEYEDYEAEDYDYPELNYDAVECEDPLTGEIYWELQEV